MLLSSNKDYMFGCGFGDSMKSIAETKNPKVRTKRIIKKMSKSEIM